MFNNSSCFYVSAEIFVSVQRSSLLLFYLWFSLVLFQDGEMRFSEEMFLDHKSSSMRNFLQSAIHLQFFKQVWTNPWGVCACGYINFY